MAAPCIPSISNGSLAQGWKHKKTPFRTLSRMQSAGDGYSRMPVTSRVTSTLLGSVPLSFKSDGQPASLEQDPTLHAIWDNDRTEVQ